MEERGGDNLYCFVRNNGLNSVDPLGLSTIARSLCAGWEIVTDDAADDTSTGWQYQGVWGSVGGWFGWDWWLYNRITWKQPANASHFVPCCQKERRFGLLVAMFSEETQWTVGVEVPVTKFLSVSVSQSQSTTNSFGQGLGWEVSANDEYDHMFYLVAEFRVDAWDWGDACLGYGGAHCHTYWRPDDKKYGGYTGKIGLVHCRQACKHKQQ